uniref:TRUD domain-containing protein n=1 Tax=Panagrellus redivivus TaxID=6233 RepID=A0A7E4VA11_PANRE
MPSPEIDAATTAAEAATITPEVDHRLDELEPEISAIEKNPSDIENVVTETPVETVIFKRFFEDFIVVEKHDDKLCGQWPVKETKLHEFKEHDRVPKPDFITEEVEAGIRKVYEEKKGTAHIPMVGDQNNKELRKQVHLYLRGEFDNKLNSVSTDSGIDITYSFNRRKDDRLAWPKDVGRFLHFTMKKSDHENSYAINKIARAIKVSNKVFNYAGCKDRRAVTYQRVCAFRVPAEKLIAVQDQLVKDHVAVSEFEYHEDRINFGDHTANLFYIILRNADIDEDKFEYIKTYGILNYFGPQRFGSVSGNTDAVGLHILKKEYKEAVDLMTDPSNVSDPELKAALTQYRDTGTLKGVEGKATRVWHSRPFEIIKAVQRFEKQPDKHYRALMDLDRPSRSMYVHAYQSRIFNKFVEIYTAKHGIAHCIDLEVPLVSHYVTEANSEVYEIYKELLAADGLTFESFKHLEKTFSVFETFRSVVIMPQDMTFKRIQHEDLDAPLVFYPPQESEPDLGTGYQSILLTFSLRPGSYATTVLSELYGKSFTTKHPTDPKPQPVEAN